MLKEIIVHTTYVIYIPRCETLQISRDFDTFEVSTILLDVHISYLICNSGKFKLF